MMKTVQQRLKQATLPLLMLAALFSVQHSAQARTDRLVIEDGDNSLTKEEAHQQKEQWDIR
ncbi:DUF1283 domain-containing protein [Candidatus Erwinia dacicola]|nr:DUF1283 domain-containing protein [Candidatus Erwinia dacicola]